MSAAVQSFPVTGFRSNHPFSKMSERAGSSPSRRKDVLPMRPGLTSREPSKEDIELAESLIGHAQGNRNTTQQAGQYPRGSQSPFEERHSPMSTSSTSDQNYDTPGSDRDQSYAPLTSFGPGSVPNGQVCR